MDAGRLLSPEGIQPEDFLRLLREYYIREADIDEIGHFSQ